MRLIVAITGASGSIYGIRLLEKLRQAPGIEVHLVMTRTGEQTIRIETGRTADDIRRMAHHCHPIDDLASELASGSFPVSGMVVAPCSVRTLSSIACGISSNLLLRAADVTLKERRRLVLMVRESPLHLGHIRAMAAVTEMGAIVAPPVPAFYNRPESVMDIVDSSVHRVLDLLGLPSPEARRWNPANAEAGR